jgi:hypothetical protein
MPRTLSSNWTFFWKFILPGLLFSGLGFSTLLAFTESQGFPHRGDKWVLLAGWPVTFLYLFLFMRAKRVRMDSEFLCISNYLTEAKIPLGEVWAVNVMALRLSSARGTSELMLRPFTVVEFQGRTRFGKRIVFMARGPAVPPEPWTHPVVTEIRAAVDQALLGSTRPEDFVPCDLGRAREAESRANFTRLPAPSKPTLQSQVRYMRRYFLLLGFFAFPGLFFLVGLVIAVAGARAATINFFAEGRTLGTGASAAILIAFTLYLGAYFVAVLSSYFAPARVVPYFERSLDFKMQGAFKNGFALAKGFDVLERRASELGVTPLSAFGFGDDMLGQLLVWHSTETGLKTVQALVASSHNEALDAKLLEDLQAVEAALERAAAKAVRFTLVVRIGADKWISGAEMFQRKGSFW